MIASSGGWTNGGSRPSQDVICSGGRSRGSTWARVAGVWLASLTLGSGPVLSAPFAGPMPQGVPVATEEPTAEMDEFATELAALATKTVWFVTAVALVGIVLWWYGGRRRRHQERIPDSLLCTAHMPLSARSRVALLQVGLQHVLVGHDNTGIRSMVLLPPGFDELSRAEPLDLQALVDAPAEEAPYRAAHLRLRFLDVGDSGWELNRPIT